MERGDFVQIYLFHTNGMRLKTSQYISGASALILSKVYACKMETIGLASDWTLIAKTMWEATVGMLDWAP